ncbi:DUF2520 domain-containing protein [candidate division WOR-3 bacterium]|nr:DUF2520 domain-containing protein [candidate division WOR-3 bacterium]
MKIGIIGSGRVGTALGGAFKQAGYGITGIVSRNQEHAKRCMRITGCKYWSSNPQDLLGKADFILIVVPDSQIESVVKAIRELPLLNDIILAHTSGVVPSNILGVKHSLSMHPISSCAGGKLPRGTYFGIEGDIEVGERLVKSIGGIPIVIPSEHKALYHAGLNFGAAYILTLFEEGCKLLELSGVKEPEKVMLSLASSTLRNAKKFGIKNSLTGPIERGDTKIVEEELEAIKKMTPEDLKLYKMLAKETQKFTEKKFNHE